jgi:CO dehydrogenase/acetyl-CoA synthase beta subunit
MKQANKHRKEINYEIESKMFLNERNIITARLFKKLDDKMLDSFKITDSVDFFYKLKLSDTMRIHDVFHSELLRSAVNDLLSDQKNEFSKLIVINNENE